MAAEIKRIKELFLAALEKGDRSQRDAWLRTECADDEPLRRQIEDLLRKHDEAGNFLEPPPHLPETSDACPGTSARALHETVGGHIGPYTLHERLGEGGMGAVYLAEQQHPVRRRVALKVVKAGMD